MVNYLNVGKIVNTHGIKGEVRVQSMTDKPEERYLKGTKLVVKQAANEYIPVTVKSHRVHKSFDLLTFEEYNSINDVEIFKGHLLQISEEDLPQLDGNEYYNSELIGLKVIDEENTNIGKVKEILSLPANDVWVVGRQNKNDLLLPAIASVILEVNLTENFVKVHVLEGLDEDEDED